MEYPLPRSLDNESLALALWHEHMCIAVEAIQYPCGKVALLSDIENSVDAIGLTIMRRLAVVRETDLLGWLAQDRQPHDPCMIGGDSPFAKIVASWQGVEYQITAGDVTGHGSYGYIAVSDVNGKMIWHLFLSDQNPFQEVFLIDGVVHAFSTSWSWCTLRIDSPRIVHCEYREDWKEYESDRNALSLVITEHARHLQLSEI